LIRRVLPDLDEDFGGMPLGMALLEPTRLYVKPILGLMEEVEIRGMAHITGGGFYENIPRMFPQSPEGGALLDALIRDPWGGPEGPGPGIPGRAWTVPPLFARIAYGVSGGPLRGAAAQEAGMERLRTDGVLRKLMFNTFNMGIGFVLALAPGDIPKAAAYLDCRGFPAWEIGRVEAPKGRTGELRFV
jgi:phosphoribosylformylglycinamidine cyclo-ligase